MFPQKATATPTQRSQCHSGSETEWDVRESVTARATVRLARARGGGAFETLPGATACWAWLLTSTESGTHGLDGAELMSSAELAASVGAATSLVHRRAAGVAAGAFSERASPSSSVSASSNNDSSSGNGGGRGGERLRRSVGVQSTRGTGSTTPLHRAVGAHRGCAWSALRAARARCWRCRRPTPPRPAAL